MTVRIKTSRRPFECRRKRRRGYTLVFFAMMLFAIMVLAALVIDIGLARLTQRQMQTAADSAAVEGLRREGTLDGGERRGRFSVTFGRGPTDAPDADLYANGPAVPYLFARGSLINRRLIDAGMTVSGTGQAKPAPALSIGLARDSATPPLAGLLPVSLELSYWNGLTTHAADVQMVTSGEMGTSGRFFAIGTAESMPLTMGRLIPAAAIPVDGTYIGYVPIHANLTVTATQRVVGFGSVQVDVKGGGTMASITQQPARVGVENVSAVRCHSVGLSSAEARELMALMSEVNEPLLAPSLRSVGL